MKKCLFVALLLLGSFLLAQDTMPVDNGQGSKDARGETTVTGCVSRSNGDYILMKENPPMTYELQATGKTRLKNYLGQRVEVTGNQSPTMSSSSDATAKQGSAAPVTITISTIRTVNKECSERGITR